LLITGLTFHTGERAVDRPALVKKTLLCRPREKIPGHFRPWHPDTPRFVASRAYHGPTMPLVACAAMTMAMIVPSVPPMSPNLGIVHSIPAVPVTSALANGTL
jgi:hypothetical protein